MSSALGLFAANAAGAQWPMSSSERAAAMHANMWHAYADAAELTSRSSILVTGGHGPVRLRSGDRLTIEMPEGERYELLILHREGHSIRTADQNGSVHNLLLTDGAETFKDFMLGEGFSREIWSIQ